MNGHGRMMDPPSRNAMWRFGFPNPVNYNDNEVFCGGYGGENCCKKLNWKKSTRSFVYIVLTQNGLDTIVNFLFL